MCLSVCLHIRASAMWYRDSLGYVQ